MAMCRLHRCCLCEHRGTATPTCAGCCDGLPELFVLHVTGCKHTRHAGDGAAWGGDDIAVLIQLELRQQAVTTTCVSTNESAIMCQHYLCRHDCDLSASCWWLLYVQQHVGYYSVADGRKQRGAKIGPLQQL